MPVYTHEHVCVWGRRGSVPLSVKCLLTFSWTSCHLCLFHSFPVSQCVLVWIMHCCVSPAKTECDSLCSLIDRFWLRREETAMKRNKGEDNTESCGEWGGCDVKWRRKEESWLCVIVLHLNLISHHNTSCQALVISGEGRKLCIMDTTVHNLKFEISKTFTEHAGLLLFWFRGNKYYYVGWKFGLKISNWSNHQCLGW